MSRIVFLNGDYLPADEAKISIFDRAVNFGDAIYEVAGVLDGKLVDFEHHMQRYFNSLHKLAIESPLEQAQILDAFRKLVELNRLDEGLVYMQVTRGEAERDFVWPEDIRPTIFMFTQPKAAVENQAAESGVTLASTADIRWARRDIKSVNLLAQVLAKKAAADAGAYEALMVDADGYVTECGSTSFFITDSTIEQRYPARGHPPRGGRAVQQARSAPGGKPIHAGRDARRGRGLHQRRLQLHPAGSQNRRPPDQRRQARRTNPQAARHLHRSRPRQPDLISRL
jgi:hypothetical protein